MYDNEIISAFPNIKQQTSHNNSYHQCLLILLRIFILVASSLAISKIEIASGTVTLLAGHQEDNTAYENSLWQPLIRT